MTRISVLILAISLGGCDLFESPFSDVELRTEAAAYAPGVHVTLTLENGSREEVGYNLCFLNLELLQDGEPVPVILSERETVACQSYLALLRPGRQSRGTAFLPEDLPAGTYQLATDIEINNDRRPVLTEPFEVR